MHAPKKEGGGIITITLTQTGEVAQFLNESQFQGGLTAYACVAFAASLLRYSAQPGHSITGTNAQVATTAFEWYQKLEGSDLASNTNGMSLQAEYTMLQGLGLRYYPVQGNFLVYIKAWLELGYPLLICGAETGMHDLDMGDNVPYSWTPTGNHAIVASGIASDGNLLVRDTASIAPTGVRPGPRRYDISKLQLISATAVGMPWLPVLPSTFDPTKQEDQPMPITINSPQASGFKELDASHWQCTSNGHIIQFGLLADYKVRGYSFLGMPWSNEITLSSGHAIQWYQYGVRQWLNGVVSSVDLYNDGIGTDPRLVTARQTIQQLQAQLAAQPPSQDPQAGQALVDMQQIKAIAGKY